MKNTNKTEAEKKAILIKHYSIEEIAEILGFFDGSNDDVDTQVNNDLYEHDAEGFKNAMLEAAIKNGCFDEAISLDVRVAL